MTQVNNDYPGFVFDTPVFRASDFGATAAMTWVVSAGNLTTFRYGLFGNMMMLWLAITGSTIGGTETGASLTLKIPGGRLAARSFSAFLHWSGPFGIDEVVLVEGAAGSNILTIRRLGSQDFLASVGDEGISGELFFEIE